MSKTKLHTVTITLLGGGAPFLVGYSGFALMEVRRFKPERTDARVLSGPHYRQPDVGIPTPYRLNVLRGARALLIRGRAFDRDNDVHVPLVYQPGSRVEIPLPAPPLVPAGTLPRLAQLVRRVAWTDAVTYHDTFPHEYSRRSTWPNDADFVFAATMIARYGYRAWFKGTHSAGWWTQLDLAVDGTAFTFWTGFQRPDAHLWINRRSLTDRAPVPQRVRQVLIAEDARLLDIADPHALAVALFPEP